MAQLIDLVKADGLNADELGHAFHVGFRCTQSTKCPPGSVILLDGGGTRRPCRRCRTSRTRSEYPERDELAVELVDAVGVVPHEQEVGSRGASSSQCARWSRRVDDAVGVRVLRHVPP